MGVPRGGCGVSKCSQCRTEAGAALAGRLELAECEGDCGVSARSCVGGEEGAWCVASQRKCTSEQAGQAGQAVHAAQAQQHRQRRQPRAARGGGAGGGNVAPRVLAGSHSSVHAAAAAAAAVSRSACHTQRLAGTVLAGDGGGSGVVLASCWQDAAQSRLPCRAAAACMQRQQQPAAASQGQRQSSGSGGNSTDAAGTTCAPPAAHYPRRTLRCCRTLRPTPLLQSFSPTAACFLLRIQPSGLPLRAASGRWPARQADAGTSAHTQALHAAAHAPASLSSRHRAPQQPLDAPSSETTRRQYLRPPARTAVTAACKAQKPGEQTCSMRQATLMRLQATRSGHAELRWRPAASGPASARQHAAPFQAPIGSIRQRM